MAKGRQRKETRSLENVSPHLHEDGWVIVKKQTVTILLPPLPVSETSTACEPGPNPVEELTEHVSEHVSEQNRKVGSPLHPTEMYNLLKTSSKIVKQTGGFIGPSCSLPTVNFLVNKRLRARNLERKLKIAGGLGRWLMSLGLGQFVRMFERRRVNKFQLSGLTMQKLKEMGAAPVGPRRKLMHAIDCCCEPCFI